MNDVSSMRMLSQNEQILTDIDSIDTTVIINFN